MAGLVQMRAMSKKRAIGRIAAAAKPRGVQPSITVAWLRDLRTTITIERHAHRLDAVSTEDTGVNPVKNPDSGDGKGLPVTRYAYTGPSQKTGLSPG